MKLDAATYHDIINLTTNVAVSPAEAEAWKKCLLATADEKIKMQRSQLTVMLGDPRVEGCKTHGQGKSRGWWRGWIFQSVIISREGLILTLSILPCPQGRIF